MPLTYFWQSIWVIIQIFLAFQKFLSLFPSNAEDRFSPDLHCIHVWQARESQHNRSICRRFMYFFTEWTSRWRHTCVRVQGSIPLDENKRTIFVLLKAFISVCSKQERENLFPENRKSCFSRQAREWQMRINCRQGRRELSYDLNDNPELDTLWIKLEVKRIKDCKEI